MDKEDAVHVCCVRSLQSCPSVRTVARRAPLSMGFPRQEYWSGLPCPPPEDLPRPGMEPTSPASPALAGGFFPTSTTWEAQSLYNLQLFYKIYTNASLDYIIAH